MTSLLNNVGAWVHGCRGSNFSVGSMGSLGSKSFGVGQKNDMGRNFGMGSVGGVGT